MKEDLSYETKNMGDVSTQASTKVIKEKLYKLMNRVCVLLNGKLNGQEDFDTRLSGSTGILVACIRGYIITANVGDSRAILLTEKPDRSLKRKIVFKKRSKSINPRKDSNIESSNDTYNTIFSSYSLSRDLVPSLDIERERILNSGGEVHPSIGKFSIFPKIDFNLF
jgi:serine/threonine protein phosphatase PrpC